jgi:hypothetical protein
MDKVMLSLKVMATPAIGRPRVSTPR